MKWKQEGIKKCLNQAIDTFTDLLAEDGRDEVFELEQDFVDLVANEQFDIEDISFDSIGEIRTVHTATFENPAEAGLFYGALVILKTKKGQILLDGNHRYNTLKESGKILKVCVIFIELDTDLI